MMRQSFNLFYENDSESFIPLPYWADFFVTLGYVIAGAGVAERRSVMALAVPTRAYVAALVGIGIVIRRAEAQDDAPVSALDHFNWLCSHDVGTPVLIERGDNKYEPGVIWEPKVWVQGGEPRLVVKTATGGNLIYKLPVQLCLKVEISSRKPSRLPTNPRLKSIERNIGFVEKVMQGCNIGKMICRTQPDVVIIGRLWALLNETNQTDFAVRDHTGNFEIGVLNDILAVKKFSGHKHSYRSDVLPAHGKLSHILPHILFPTVTVFDGATGFLKWRDSTRQSDWIVILDRTDNYIDEAAKIISTAYLGYRDHLDVSDLGPAPKGIEFVCYRESQ